MSVTQNLPQNPTNGQPAPDPQDADAWLQAKIEYYQGEVARLEAELKHTKILLRGHETWLADLQRKAGGER